MSRRVAARHRAFQSTLPGWGATRRAEGAHVLNHFNPRSPDGERQKAYRNNHPIHYFNPRSPDGERRLAQCVRLIILGFQSTLPGWGATRSSRSFGSSMLKFQSTLPGWGATGGRAGIATACVVFQSTLPGWGATNNDGVVEYDDMISIHAPRMGSDTSSPSSVIGSAHFNPRSPDGERHKPNKKSPKTGTISIHAPRMGSDFRATTAPSASSIFQSTLPGWGATAKMDIFAHDMGKIIHFQH